MIVLFFLGCHSESVPTYAKDIAPIINGRCINCHQDGGIGGFDFSDPETVRQLAPLIAHQVESGAMPPWPAVDVVSYDNDWSLTSQQIALVVAWANGGTPMGDLSSLAAPIPSVGGGLSRTDTTLSMSLPYGPTPGSGDDYRCFVLDWNAEESTNITGFNARPGNAAIVHHIAAFLVRPDGLLGESVFDQIQEWEEADTEPGYPCFGGPAGPGAEVQVPIEQLAQWVPGNQGIDFPEGTGITIDPGSKIILQLHYYAAPGISNTSDRTEIDLRLDDEVERPAAYSPYLNGLWPLGNMEIPSGEDSVSHIVSSDPRPFFSLLNDTIDLEHGFVIHDAMLHMHRLGRSGYLNLIKSNGDEYPILHVDSWDFDWQFSYRLNEPLIFEDGDSLSLECVFDNSGEDSIDVNWGEGTEDEMCVGNLYISTP